MILEVEGLKIDVSMVFCGNCLNIIDIEEWCGEVPHPNRSHLCHACGKLWEPDSGVWGDKNCVCEDLMFFFEDYGMDYTINEQSLTVVNYPPLKNVGILAHPFDKSLMEELKC